MNSYSRWSSLLGPESRHTCSRAQTSWQQVLLESSIHLGLARGLGYAFNYAILPCKGDRYRRSLPNALVGFAILRDVDGA